MISTIGAMKTMTKRKRSNFSSGVEALLTKASLRDEFIRGSLVLLKNIPTRDGINEGDFDAVGTSDIGTIFLKEFDPHAEPAEDDKLVLMKKSRWELMKSRKELSVEVLLSRGFLRT